MNRSIILKVLLLLAISLLIGISCGEAAPDLSMYRGIDYIQKNKFSSIVSGLNAGWVSDDPFEGSYHYMGFDPVLHVPGINDIGLPDYATGDMSRLEVFNLVPDGGFESVSSLTGWSATGGIFSRSTGHTSPPPYGITGNYCLYYEFDSSTPPPEKQINFNMTPVKDGFIPGSRYIIRLKFFKRSENTDTPLRFNSERNWNVVSIKPWTAGYTKFPENTHDNTEVVAELGSNSFYILYDTVKNMNNEGYIDDFRIVRSDIDYYLKFTVPHSEAGRPNLYSGTYRFSVWFKAEDPADLPPTPSAPLDRFNSSRVSLGIGKTLNSITLKGFDASSELISGNWEKLSVEKFIQIRDGDNLVLLISSTDKSGGNTTFDMGSVLIAYPELYYISE